VKATLRCTSPSSVECTKTHQTVHSSQQPASEPTGLALLRFASDLFGSSDLAELEQRLVTGFDRLFHAPMYALYILDPLTGRPGDVAPVNVSETFLARYERLPQGRESDPMYAHVLSTGEAAYNLALMSMEEWLESPLYTNVSYLHDVRHVVEVPVVHGDTMIGTINFGTSDPDRGYCAGEVRLAEALGRLVGVAVEGIRAREDLERELERTRAALELTGSAVVLSDPEALELRLNDAARRLLAQVKGGEERLYGLIAPPGEMRVGFSRHVDVEFVDGGRGHLHGYSSRLPREGRALLTVLELDREAAAGRAAGPLLPLTAREREVAALVVNGLADREIAERLHLSRHTVSQYVKRIYRKLGVDSRVALTRLLLDRRWA
jgi:DNA-binding CsgD family transcriptional regulator/GAF domain-containing protein